jgi:hypothetical protein
MAFQIVPLTSVPNQRFTANLLVDGATLILQLTLRYNEVAGYWVMTISDQFGNLLLDSIPLVTGSFPGANLLKQYGYLLIGSCYIINVGGATDFPDSSSLGTSFLMLWGDTCIP